jgi:hypothetical protein
MNAYLENMVIYATENVQLIVTSKAALKTLAIVKDVMATLMEIHVIYVDQVFMVHFALRDARLNARKVHVIEITERALLAV